MSHFHELNTPLAHLPAQTRSQRAANLNSTTSSSPQTIQKHLAQPGGHIINHERQESIARKYVTPQAEPRQDMGARPESRQLNSLDFMRAPSLDQGVVTALPPPPRFALVIVSNMTSHAAEHYIG